MSATSIYQALQMRFSKDQATDAQVLNHALGLSSLQIPNNHVANELAKHAVIICVDTEHYTCNSDEMTEAGVGILYRQETLSVHQANNLGEHGDNLMRKAKFHLFRLVEHTHLKNSNQLSHGPEGNRFGQARFVTFAELRAILQSLFVQPITNVAGLQGLHRPIIVLGHATEHDMSHLNGKDLAFDVEKCGTVIRVIDTQKIVRDFLNWNLTMDNIGLSRLVEKFGFTHSDSHTAANDAARTLMAAIQLAIQHSPCKKGSTRSMQQVAHDFEVFTQQTFTPLGGSALYCCLCGSRNHKDDACTAKDLRCDECKIRGIKNGATGHITKHCPVVAKEAAEERRRWYEDQPTVDKQAKFPFVSPLTTFAPNPTPAKNANAQEVAQRRAWYERQAGVAEPQAFFHESRSFRNTPPAELRGRPGGSGYVIAAPQLPPVPARGGGWSGRGRGEGFTGRGASGNRGRGGP